MQVQEFLGSAWRLVFRSDSAHYTACCRYTEDWEQEEPSDLHCQLLSTCMMSVTSKYTPDLRVLIHALDQGRGSILTLECFY